MMCLMGLLLTGCSDAQEDIEQVIGDEGCRVSIRVGASDNVETKAGDDPNALAGEFINELCVFVVDDQGSIEQKFLASSTAPNGTFTDDPSTGDAYEWRSSEFVLPAGKKTIYAFANWSTASNDSWNKIINKPVGETLSDTDLAITINNPAGSVDLANGKYIPMSVKQEVNVTVDQTIRVELVRLVGRVNIQLKNAKASQVSVTSFTMGKFADKVALMPEETAADVAYDQTYSTFSTEASQVIEGNNGVHTFSFYVNETENENNTPFSIQLTADNKNYSATTTATAIPRNNILPLNLTISESDLNLVVMAYIAPIGGYPVQVYTSSGLTGKAEYNVTLPEGCTFQVSGTLANGTKGTCVLDYSGTTDQNKNIEIDATNKSVAYVTALPGLTTDETKKDITPLKVSFIDNNKEVRATCTLNVSTEALKDWGKDGYPITRSLVQWGEAPRWYEAVPMMRKNP